MIFFFSRAISFLVVEQFRESHSHNTIELNVPDAYMCPITHQIMINPVTCHGSCIDTILKESLISSLRVAFIENLLSCRTFFLDGYNYEKSAIFAWFSSGKLTSPMTNEPVPVIELIPNVELQREIITFVKESASC